MIVRNMKKYLLFLLALLPMTIAFTACSDDDDLPNVDFDITYEGATSVDGVLYVVQGTSFEITGITVTNREEGKGAGISAADYYWDYVYVGTSIQPPYGFEFNVTENTPVGRHQLDIQSTVFAVDKTIAQAVCSFQVQVVASADDIPDGGESTVHVTPQVSTTTDK